MRSLACLLILISTTFCQVLAQKGGYYITHHSPDLETVDNTNFTLLQDNNGMLCIANRKGVMIYDGIYWDLVQTPSSVFSLGLSEDNTLFLGCRDGFGKLNRTADGITYQPLSTGYDIQDVFEVETLNDKVYFLSEDLLMIYSMEKDEITKVIEGPGDFYFNSIFKLNDKIYVDIELEGVYEVAETGLERANQFEKGTDIILTDKNPNAEELITVTGENELMLLRSGKLWPLEVKNLDYLKETDVTDVTWVNDTLIAIATVQRGCLLINPIDREVTDVIDYSTGLIENEIYAVSSDTDQGIWLMHSYGLSRIDPNLPVYNYGIYPGIEGNILTVHKDSLLYVGTSAGLFVLNRVKRFEEVEYKVTVNTTELITVKVPPSDAQGQTDENELEEISLEELENVTVKKRKKGFLRILGKKDKKKKNQEDIPIEEEVVEIPKEEPKTQTAQTRTIRRPVSRTEIRTRNELKSDRFEFSKMVEIGLRCDEIIEFGEQLIVVSSKGIHEISGKEVNLISDVPARRVILTRDKRWIVAVLADEQVALIGREEEGWGEPRYFDFLYDEIFSITQDSEGTLWLIGSTNVYKALINNGELDILDRYDLDNPYYDQYFPYVGKQNLFLVSASNYSVFNKTENNFTTHPADSIWGNRIEKIIQDGKDLWVSNGERWTAMSKDISQSNLALMMLWRNIGKINRSDEQLWIVTENNEINRLDLRESYDINWSNNLMLKTIRNRSQVLEIEENLSINSENNQVSFEFRYPGYVNQDDLRYQFNLRGPANSVTQWTSNNTIAYSYLPAGKYELSVKSRNGAGEVVEGKIYSFRIVPPYWERPWFYALEALFFGFLFYMSIRMNRQNPGNFVSKILAFFTLILIIEFIQTSVEARIVTDSSLFITFLVNAGIALLIFPFERLLRSVIIKNQGKTD